MQPRYIVCVPIAGQAELAELCMCLDPESAAEVVRALLSAWGNEPKDVTVRLRVFQLPA